MDSVARLVCKTRIANIASQWAADRSLLALMRLHTCSACDKVFNMYHKLKLHKLKAHGIKNQLRLYVDTTCCTVGMTEFRNRERLMSHLRYRSAICRSHVLLGQPVLTEVQADQMDHSSQLAVVVSLCELALLSFTWPPSASDVGRLPAHQASSFGQGPELRPIIFWSLLFEFVLL